MAVVLDDQAIEEIYGKLKAWGEPVRADRRLAGPHVHSVTVRSPLCGSELTLDAEISGDRVRALGYATRACSLGTATTGIVRRHLADLDAATVQRVGAQLERILKGEPIACDWPELEIFTFAEDIPVRHGSALLPFRALEKLFARARAENGKPGG